MWCNLIHSLAVRQTLAGVHLPALFPQPIFPLHFIILHLPHLAFKRKYLSTLALTSSGLHTEYHLNDLGKKLGIITVCHLKNDHILSLFRASCHTDSLVPSWCVTRIGFVTLRLSIRSIRLNMAMVVRRRGDCDVQILARDWTHYKETGCFTLTEIVETLVLCELVALKIAVRKTSFCRSDGCEF